MGNVGWIVGAALGGLVASAAQAADLHAAMALTTPNGPGSSVGQITVHGTAKGAVFRVNLKGLPPGSHGFHVHAGDSCAPGPVGGQTVPAGAAAGHFDPAATGKHLGPENSGHLGDLPVLEVKSNGTATQSLTAPHLKDLKVLEGHALVIHAGGDNYSDSPAPLGGGGARIACGVLR